MPNPVVIEFLMKGIPQIQAGMRNVEDVIARAERNSTRATQRQSQDRQRTAQQEAREKIRAMQKADTWERQAIARGTREAEQAAKAKARIEERAAREKVQAQVRADREVRRINERALKEAERDAQRLAAIRERSATMAGRFAAKQAAEQQRASMRWVRQREREQRLERIEAYHNRRRFIQHVGGAAGVGVQRGLQRAGAIATGLANTVAQLGGGFSVTDAVQRQANLERDAVGFINASADRTGLNVADIQSRARAASMRTGIEATDVLAAGRAFLSKTGNAQEALSNMEMFGELATGTGASIEDIAKAAGTLRVQNASLTPEQMRETLLQVVRQGQKGSIEFSDLAGSIGKITKSSASYAGSQTTNQAKLLGLAQVAMATAGSPEEAATVVSNIAQDAGKHADKIQGALGEGAFNARGQLAKAPEEFIADVMEKTGGNLQKIQGLGFGARSMKLFQALAPGFNEATDAGTSGREAVLKRMRDATASPMEYSELQGNVAKVMKTSAMQFETSMRELRDEVGTQLLPELVKLVPVLKDATPHVRKFLEHMIRLAEWAGRHPFAGLAALISASVIGEITKAGIGEAFKFAIQRALGPPGAGGGGPLLGGGNGLGKVGSALALTGAGLLAGELTKEAIDAGYGTLEQRANTRLSRQLSAENLIAGARRGVLTPEQQREAHALLASMKDDLGKQKAERGSYSAVEWVTGAMANIVDPKGAKEAAEATAAARSASIQGTEDSIRRLIDALNENTRVTRGSGTTTNSGPDGAARDQSIVQRN